METRLATTLLLALALVLGCPGDGPVDDDTTGDDDSGATDDDSTSDDDTVGDDDSGATDDDSAGDDDTGEDLTSPRSALFIGNSHTFTNDLPGMLQQLAATSPLGLDLSCGDVTQGGATLEQLFADGMAVEAIGAQPWTYVVLQEQSTRPLTDPELMWEAVRQFDDVIDASGAQTTLFLMWARRDFAWTQDQITDAYVTIGEEVDALIAPVGIAWEMALEQQPDLDLHSPDGSHPGPKGTYLAACVFLATFYGVSPEGVGHEMVPQLDGDTAAFLQQIAWEAVETFSAGRAP